MPRHNRKRHQGKTTNNVTFAAAKAASDATVANGDPNPTPMGRPWPTQEAGV